MRDPGKSGPFCGHAKGPGRTLYLFASRLALSGKTPNRMNKQIPALAALLLCSALPLQAQVYGNYQYSQNQPLAQGHDRAAVSNTAIAVNNEVSLKINGLMNIVADN